MDKSKKITNQHQTNPSDDQPDLQFLQDEQIVQMIPLEYMGSENLPRYVTENMQYVQDFQENEVQLLQIPVDSDIVIEDWGGTDFIFTSITKNIKYSICYKSAGYILKNLVISKECSSLRIQLNSIIYLL